jgi:hypothetical protein
MHSPIGPMTGVMNGPKTTSASAPLPTADIGRRGPQVAFVSILLQKYFDRLSAQH